jgi:hypothetical protein
MDRNLDRRVEAVVPVEDTRPAPDRRDRRADAADDRRSWQLRPDAAGSGRRPSRAPGHDRHVRGCLKDARDSGAGPSRAPGAATGAVSVAGPAACSGRSSSSTGQRPRPPGAAARRDQLGGLPATRWRRETSSSRIATSTPRTGALAQPASRSAPPAGARDDRVRQVARPRTARRRLAREELEGRRIASRRAVGLAGSDARRLVLEHCRRRAARRTGDDPPAPSRALRPASDAGRAEPRRGRRRQPGPDRRSFTRARSRARQGRSTGSCRRSGPPIEPEAGCSAPGRASWSGARCTRRLEGMATSQDAKPPARSRTRGRRVRTRHGEFRDRRRGGKAEARRAESTGKDPWCRSSPRAPSPRRVAW